MNAGITAEDNRSELSAGSTVTLEITAYGSEGQGIARHNGMAVFVPGAICGETVEAEIKTIVHPQRVREAESRAVRQFVKWAAEGAWKGRMRAEEMQTYLIEA